MIFCFSGTGNSRYIAQRIAEALQKTVIDLNARIKDNDTTTVDTGSDVVMVTPTYAWRIPKIVSEWMAKTKWTGAKRIWFVMDCGSEIGDAAKYNRRLAEKKKWQYMGTAQIVMPVHIVWHASAIARRKLSNMERRALENHAIIWIDKCKEILRILFYIFNNCLL